MSAEIPDDNPIVLFDGVCSLCHGVVQFIVPRDTEQKFRFASLQSDVGRKLLARHDLPTDELESIVLIEGDKSYMKSSAVIRIGAHLGGIYALLSPFRVVPRSIRDRAYDFVANRRYRWFGEKDRCTRPTGNIETRFLD